MALLEMPTKILRVDLLFQKNKKFVVNNFFN